MNLELIMKKLRDETNVAHAKSMSHYAIDAPMAFGIKLPVLRKLAKEVGKDTKLAKELWDEGHHEGKLLATLIAEPNEMGLKELDVWVSQIYSWDVCDQMCINLLVKKEQRWDFPFHWSSDEREYVRRAGLVMIVALRIHDKKARDKDFEKFFPLLKEHATDERNFVKKAVNWAIRELGKRSAIHHPRMLELCHELLQMESASAKWIARDALRELESEKVKLRLQKL